MKKAKPKGTKVTEKKKRMYLLESIPMGCATGTKKVFRNKADMIKHQKFMLSRGRYTFRITTQK